MVTLLEEIVEWSILKDKELWTDKELATIKKAFIDTIAVSYAAKKEPIVQLLKQNFKNISHESHCIAFPISGDAKSIGLLNGTMAHALDYDDVSPTMQGHPSTTLVPAILTMARDQSGYELLNAYRCGFEVMSYLGRIMGFTHYESGWHPTLSLGVIGSTVAICKLKKLTIETFCHAVGLATTFAGGLRENFGTMTKPLHAGFAVQQAIQAVELAEIGVTSSKGCLDGEFGYLRTFSSQMVASINSKIGDYTELNETGIGIKKYPCCYATHRFIDAALTMKVMDVSTIQEIHAIGPEGIFSPLNYTHPQTINEAKFSAEYAICTALIDGKVDLNSFTSENIERQIMKKLMKKVKRIENPQIPVLFSPMDEGWIELIIFTKDASSSCQVKFPKGSYQSPLTFEELKEKATDCMQEHYHDEWFEGWRNLEKLTQYQNSR